MERGAPSLGPCPWTWSPRTTSPRLGAGSVLQAGALQVRVLTTVLVRALQRLLHRGLVMPIIDGVRMGPPAPLLALIHRVPQLSFVPAYLIGVGLRPEHAPEFARRSAEEP